MNSLVETYHGYDVHIFSFGYVIKKCGYSMIFSIERQGKRIFGLPCFISALGFLEEVKPAEVEQNAEKILLKKGLQRIHERIDSGQFFTEGETYEEYQVDH